jgi:peptidoglycan/LPS O-acetylase OafA/YrhL
LPGKYSYGNYLLHTTVLYFLAPRLAGGNIYMAFLIFAMASTAAAALSFHFFEAPANRWIRKKLKAA